MKSVRACFCILLTLFAACFPLLADEPDPEAAEIVRTGLTLAGAGIGLAAGSAISIGFSQDAIDTPVSNMLLLAIPVAAAGLAAGAIAGRGVANIVLEQQPPLLLAIVEGAGLGLAAGAFVGSITFSLNFVIAYPILDVPEGYWGRFDYPQTVGMALLAGAVWGGILGTVIGAIGVPIISLSMGF